MLIYVNTGNLVCNSCGVIPINERVNSIFMDTDWRNEPIDWFEKGIVFDSPSFMLSDNGFEAVFLPTNYLGEIYYYQDSENEIICFSDDLFELAKAYGINEANNIASFSTSWEGCLPPGETCNSSIRRLQPHSAYVIRNNLLVRYQLPIFDLSHLGKAQLYENFKVRLGLLLEQKTASKIGLCLSGGADSRLLAMLLTEQGASVDSFCSSFTKDMRQCECGLAGEVADIIGIDFTPVVLFDSDWTSENLKKIVARMPESAHTSIPFLKISEKIGNNYDTILSGQNADGFSGFAATDKVEFSFHGLLGLFKRVCLSSAYLKGYPDVENGTVLNYIFKSLVNVLGSSAYSQLKNRIVESPRSANQLVFNFYNSYDYTVFSEQKSDFPISDDVMSCRNVWSCLFSGMIDHLCKSGAPDIIRTTMNLSRERDVVLPYSDEWVIPIFYSQFYGLNYIVHPKSMIYSYVNELAQKTDKRLSRFDPKDFGLPKTNFNIHEYYCHVIETTQLGHYLTRYSKSPLKQKGETFAEFFRRLLIECWGMETENYLKMI